MLRVDWFRILADINTRGVTIVEISERTTIPRSTIQDLKNGSEPRFCDGEAILTLWRELMSAPPRTADTKRSRVT